MDSSTPVSPQFSLPNIDATFSETLALSTPTQSKALVMRQLTNVRSAHEALEAAIARAEAARAAPLEVAPMALLNKIIEIDGRRSASIKASTEEVMDIVKTLYGRDVQLVGAKETSEAGEPVLELRFERTSSFPITAMLAA